MQGKSLQECLEFECCDLESQSKDTLIRSNVFVSEFLKYPGTFFIFIPTSKGQYIIHIEI